MQSVEELEKWNGLSGSMTLIGLGRLGLRTALNLMQVHRGGPKQIILIDGQRISRGDLIFMLMGGRVGEYKVDFIKRLAGPEYPREIIPITEDISETNRGLIAGEVVCIEIAGGDTLPVTASIIHHAHSIRAKTLSTMGVFGYGGEEILVKEIEEADPENLIVKTLLDYGVRDHLLIGTGKLIRDREPVTPHVLDRISQVMSGEILKKMMQDP